MGAVPGMAEAEFTGSRKWMIRAVNDHADRLGAAIGAVWPEVTGIDWRAPLRDDGFAEYRDAAALERVGLAEHAEALKAFWPRRGPQWDALATFDGGGVLLVEAKAHRGEANSPGSKASKTSRKLIDPSLERAARAFGAPEGSIWAERFYQYAARLAHLHFLIECGVDARLLFVGFVGDAEMRGPQEAAHWIAKTAEIEAALGIDQEPGDRKTRRLRERVAHIHPDVAALGG